MQALITLVFVFATAIAADPSVPAPEWKKFTDTCTGFEVWQVTSHPSKNCPMYFDGQGFACNDTFLLFGSDRDSGWTLYRADLTTGMTERLAPIKHAWGYCLHPDGRHAYYLADWELRRIDVRTKKIDTVIDFTGVTSAQPGFRAGSMSITADGKWLLLPQKEEMYLANLKTATVKKVYTIQGRYQHPFICPTDSNLLTFNPPDLQNDMTLSDSARARTMVVDLRTQALRPLVVAPRGSRAVHDSWSRDGMRYFFFRKTEPGWIPASICSVDRNGKDLRTHFTAMTLPLGHGVASYDRRWFITDTQPWDPATGKLGSDPWLILLNLVTGDTVTIARPGSSYENFKQYSHVHPFFSPSGRFVCYQSDVTGLPQVYVVPIGRIVDAAKKTTKSRKS